MSFMVCVGKPVIFKFEWAKHSHIRISIGHVGFWLFFFDMEVFFGQVKQIIESRQNEA